MTRGSLSDLADALHALCAEHEWHSVAHPVVTNCCDHLRAIARIHEMNAELLAREIPLLKYPLNPR